MCVQTHSAAPSRASSHPPVTWEPDEEKHTGLGFFCLTLLLRKTTSLSLAFLSETTPWKPHQASRLPVHRPLKSLRTACVPFLSQPTTDSSSPRSRSQSLQGRAARASGPSSAARGHALHGAPGQHMWCGRSAHREAQAGSGTDEGLRHSSPRSPPAPPPRPSPGAKDLYIHIAVTALGAT